MTETLDAPLLDYKPWHTDDVAARCCRHTRLNSVLLWLLDAWCTLPEFIQLARTCRALHVIVRELWRVLVAKDIRKLALFVDEQRLQPWRALLSVAHLSRARRSFDVCACDVWALVQFRKGVNANRRALVLLQAVDAQHVRLVSVRSCFTLAPKPCEFTGQVLRHHAQQLLGDSGTISLACVLSAVRAEAVMQSRLP